MLISLATSIKAFYVVIDRERLSEGRTPIRTDKFDIHKCFWKNQWLGLIINIHIMTVRLPEEKLLSWVTSINITWHTKMKSFTLLEGVTLLEHLEQAASVCPWDIHFYCALCSVANNCFRSRNKILHQVYWWDRERFVIVGFSNTCWYQITHWFCRIPRV